MLLIVHNHHLYFIRSIKYLIQFAFGSILIILTLQHVNVSVTVF